MRSVPPRMGPEEGLTEDEDGDHDCADGDGVPCPLGSQCEQQGMGLSDAIAGG